MIKINFYFRHYLKVRNERQNRKMPVSNIIISSTGDPKNDRCMYTKENGENSLTPITELKEEK